MKKTFRILNILTIFVLICSFQSFSKVNFLPPSGTFMYNVYKNKIIVGKRRFEISTYFNNVIRIFDDMLLENNYYYRKYLRNNYKMIPLEYSSEIGIDHRKSSKARKKMIYFKEKVTLCEIKKKYICLRLKKPFYISEFYFIQKFIQSNRQIPSTIYANFYLPDVVIDKSLPSKFCVLNFTTDKKYKAILKVNGIDKKYIFFDKRGVIYKIISKDYTFKLVSIK